MQRKPKNNSDNEISWIVELRINPRDIKEFKILTKSMISSASMEEGLLIYERYLDEDLNVIFIYERYINSNSAIRHLENFKNKYADKFNVLVSRESFKVFGKPSDQLRQILESYGASIFTNKMEGISKFSEIKNDI